MTLKKKLHPRAGDGMINLEMFDTDMFDHERRNR